MAIRRSMNLEHYKAQQAKPVFLTEPRRYVTRRPHLWADVLCVAALFALGFIAASIVLGML